jgi:hypothetical protein
LKLMLFQPLPYVEPLESYRGKHPPVRVDATHSALVAAEYPE